MDVLASLEKLEYHPIGFVNLGNTCYINSVLQLICCMEPLALSLGSSVLFNRQYQNAKQTSFLYCFAELLQYIWEKEKTEDFSKSLKAKGVTEALVQLVPGFSKYSQEDAHETLIFILNYLHTQTKTALPSAVNAEEEEIHQSFIIELFDLIAESTAMKRVYMDQIKVERQFKRRQCEDEVKRRFFLFFGGLAETSPVRNFLQVIFLQKVTCLECSYSSRTLQQCFDLSLPLPKQEYFLSQFTTFFAKPKLSLTHCLKDFFSEEEMQGEASYFCENCHSKQRAKKEVFLVKSPKLFVVHLSRFSQELDKNNSQVDFPLRDLDFSPFFETRRERKRAKRWGSYDLVGVVKHSGSLSSGHYVSFVRSKQGQSWNKFDDHQITSLDEASFLSDSREAYLLLYERNSCHQEERGQKLKDLREMVGDDSAETFELPLSCLLNGLLTSKCVEKTSQKALCCLHTKLRASKKSISVPLDVFHSLGGEDVVPPFKEEVCGVCEEREKSLVERRKEERILMKEILSQYKEDRQEWFFVAGFWWKDWQKFVKGESGEPGEMKLSFLIRQIERGVKLTLGKDYVPMSKDAWNRLSAIYSVESGLILKRHCKLLKVLSE